jgi:hypothetical protein
VRTDGSRLVGRAILAPAAVAGIWLFIVEVATAQEARVGGELAVETAVVGELTHIQWRLPGYEATALLTLTITDMEQEKRVLSLSRVLTQGSFGFAFLFTDRAPHRITALAEIEGKVRVRQQSVVTPIALEPPPSAALPSVVLFLTVIAAGMFTGYGSRKKRRAGMRLR